MKRLHRHKACSDLTPEVPSVAARSRELPTDHDVSDITTMVRGLTRAFSTAELLDHAIGLGAIRHRGDIDLIVDRLVIAGAMEQLAGPEAMWVASTSKAMSRSHHQPG